MSKKGMTTLEVREYNKRRVYELIYEKRSISKQEIAYELQMSMTTVTQNLKLLENEGLIAITGQYRSTGGRKANAYSIVDTAGIAIGICILKNCIHYVALNLYGEVLQNKTCLIPFQSADSYYKLLGEETISFIDLLGPGLKGRILGIGIAIQGLVSADGQYLEDGTILNCSGMKLSDLISYIPYPCRMEHDSTAAAASELWHNPGLTDAIIFILNHNLGGAIIMGGQIHHGANLRSGTLEHYQLSPHGPLCYCGHRGCLETYCSAESLQTAAGMDLAHFFSGLRQGDSHCRKVWDTWLDYMATAIRNIILVLDCNIVLSGYMAPYLIEEDLVLLRKKVQAKFLYPLKSTQIQTNHYGKLAPATGAALPYIKQWLKELTGPLL